MAISTSIPKGITLPSQQKKSDSYKLEIYEVKYRKKILCISYHLHRKKRKGGKHLFSFTQKLSKRKKTNKN
jgi:hypothetical protein